jgi:hypothetical protein
MGDDPVLVQNVLVLRSTFGASTTFRGPFELLLFPLLSTGDTDYNDSTYDKLPFDCSVAIQDDLVDTQSFLDADNTVCCKHPDAAWRREYIIGDDGGVSWSDLLARECKLFGYVLTQDAGVLTLKSIRDHALDKWLVTLSESDTATPDEMPRASMSRRGIINKWEVSTGYDYASQEYRSSVTLIDSDSVTALGSGGELTIEHPGLFRYMPSGFEPAIALRALFDEYRDLFRFPWYETTMTLQPMLIGTVFIGDVVRFQHNNFPDPLGTGSMTVDARAIVIDVAWTYGGEGAWTGTATLLVYSRYDGTDKYPWACAAMTNQGAGDNGWDATNHHFTLLEHEFGDSGTDSEDGATFDEDDEIWVIEASPADPTSYLSWGPLVVDNYNTSTNELHVKNTPTLSGWQSDRYYVIVPADWANAPTDQRSRNTWQATTADLTLNSADDPQRYG